MPDRHPRIADTGLPVEDVVGEVRAALGDTGPGHAVLVAPPGAGKTTVVPLRLLGEPWRRGTDRIVVLEPRRLAARAAAQRMAELLGEAVGVTVGYRTRDERRTSVVTRIEVVTEGILVRRVQDDPTLPGIGAVILDEVHERNLVTDLSLALLLDARAALRPDLRVLAMSATLDAERLADVLGGNRVPAPIVRSDGRVHPVAMRYDAPRAGEAVDAHAARALAATLAATDVGDVLVFLPGAADIGRVASRLKPPGALPPDVDVRRLFGALAATEQDLALAPSPAGRRRVVLATDIAESSLTVAGVRAVVDAGLVRVPRYDPAAGLTRLRTETASRAAADQRAGRAGRLGPGAAVRLWAEHDQARRAAFAEPEIATVDLAGLALELAAWGAAPRDLALIDQPPGATWADAQVLLRRLGALDDTGRPTPRGRAMADLPLHPRLARLVVEGSGHHARAAAALAALLDERDLLRGRAGEVLADLALRVALLDGPNGGGTVAGTAVDRRALATVRRRAKELSRRVRGRTDGGGGPRPGQLDPLVRPGDIGPLVALAYPDRIAQGRGDGGFRLRDGGEGSLPRSDPLAASPWLAVAELEVGGTRRRIRTAAALDLDDVLAAVGDEVTEEVDVAWDEVRNDLRATRRRRAGALVLAERVGPAPLGPATEAALLERVVATNGAALPWTAASRQLQDRLAFLHRREPDHWPDRRDSTLVATAGDWLAPMLPGATGRRDLDRLDLAAVLRAGLDHEQGRDLDRLAPTAFDAAGGRRIVISYRDAMPTASARVQDLFGTTEHPTVGGGQVPVVVELLSPANRPVQVTADLAGFWAGSWHEVRKDLAGRYPKHTWPKTPTVADAAAQRRSHRASLGRT